MPVTIEKLGHLGDGIAPGPIFVPRTLPGETIDGEILDGRIPSARIIQSSASRVSPQCPHYKYCGGCSLQHANDEFIADWKMNVVRAALEARGLPTPNRRLYTSPPNSRRRATFSGRRTKKGATIGFHAPASSAISAISNCLLVRRTILNVLPALSKMVTSAASRRTEVRISVTETETGLDVSVSGGKPLTLELRENFASVAREANLARLNWDGETIATNNKPSLRFGSAVVRPPPDSFLQATLEGELALQRLVCEALEESRGPVVDLFSGLGTFSLPIASQREVHAVEFEHDMLDALLDGWRHGTDLHLVTVEKRDLFRRPMLPDELSRFGAAVIDPPRAGAEAQTHELAKSGIARIAFVSCNPTTFARDAEILTKSGYRLDWADVVDQFRWSAHIELVAQFSLD